MTYDQRPVPYLNRSNVQLASDEKVHGIDIIARIIRSQCLQMRQLLRVDGQMEEGYKPENPSSCWGMSIRPSHRCAFRAIHHQFSILWTENRYFPLNAACKKQKTLFLLFQSSFATRGSNKIGQVVRSNDTEISSFRFVSPI